MSDTFKTYIEACDQAYANWKTASNTYYITYVKPWVK